MISTLKKQTQLVGLLAWLTVTFIAGGIGSIPSIRAENFYQQLETPGWFPSSEIFSPVWIVLYVLMAIAAWQVWRIRGFDAARKALNLFLVQLVFNALWSWFFFAWQMGALALAEIMVLWALILATMIAFWHVRPLAGLLMLPYLLWVSFAVLLNYYAWQLNPLLLG